MRPQILAELGINEKSPDYLLSRPLNEVFEFSTRTKNILERQNIITPINLVSKSEYELLRWLGFGKGSLKEIKDKLAAIGLHLGMCID